MHFGTALDGGDAVLLASAAPGYRAAVGSRPGRHGASDRDTGSCVTAPAVLVVRLRPLEQPAAPPGAGDCQSGSN